MISNADVEGNKRERGFIRIGMFRRRFKNAVNDAALVTQCVFPRVCEEDATKKMPK